jgi:hypothetical protein
VKYNSQKDLVFNFLFLLGSKQKIIRGFSLKSQDKKVLSVLQEKKQEQKKKII